MTNTVSFLNSSLGKKIQVAFSGIALCIFLLFHLLNNLTLFIGPEIFNTMVHSLESVKPIIRVMEAGLLMILLMHIFNTVFLTISNKKSASKKYAVTSSDTSSLNSRTMIITGTIILLFFIIHLRYFWYTYQIHDFLDSETYYDVIMRNQLGYLGNLPTAIFYIIAIGLIASHIKHGFQSALKTFGIQENSKWGILYKISFLFWGVIPFLFISIIISIIIGVIR